MAWYHVGACDCPVGCCSCGPSRDENIAIIYDPINDRLYEFDKTGTSRFIDWYCADIGHVFISPLLPEVKFQLWSER